MKKLSLIITIILMPFILIACIEDKISYVQPTTYPTETIVHPEVLTPTQNVPVSIFSTSRPVLLYQDFVGNNSIVAVSMDGNNQAKIQIPFDGCVRNFNKSVSPKGHWLAFYTGCETELTPESISLNLLHLPTNEVYKVTDLIANNITNDVFILDWSPDGRYIAFAGAIETPSIELYVFDIEGKNIRRLTEGLKSIEFLDWSPDGNWLLVSNDANEGSASREYFYAINLFEGNLQIPNSLFDDRYVLREGWFTSSLYFFANSSEGCCGPNSLKFIDITTGDEVDLWEDFATGYAVDKEFQITAVSSAIESDIIGTFFINVDGSTRKISDEILGALAFRGGKQSRFVGFNGNRVVTISVDGLITSISSKSHNRISVSPNGSWFVLFNDYQKNTGLDLFSESDSFVRTISIEDAVPIAWSPESKGLFYLKDDLYYIEIPSGEPILINKCEPKGCGYGYEENFIWSYP